MANSILNNSNLIGYNDGTQIQEVKGSGNALYVQEYNDPTTLTEDDLIRVDYTAVTSADNASNPSDYPSGSIGMYKTATEYKVGAVSGDAVKITTFTYRTVNNITTIKTQIPSIGTL